MSVRRNGGADASFGGRIVVTGALLLGLDTLEAPLRVWPVCRDLTRHAASATRPEVRHLGHVRSEVRLEAGGVMRHRGPSPPPES